MEQTVEDGGGDDAIAEDLTPTPEALVAGENHGSALVPPTNQLEEEIGTGPVDGQVADLVDDQQAWDREDLELVFESALGEGLGQRGDHRGRGDEQHPVAVLDGLEAQPDGEVDFAD